MLCIVKNSQELQWMVQNFYESSWNVMICHKFQFTDSVNATFFGSIWFLDMFQSFKNVSVQLRWIQIKLFMNNYEPSWAIMNLNECHELQWMSRITVNHHELSWIVNWESSRLSWITMNFLGFSRIFMNCHIFS